MRIALLGVLLASSLFACAADDESVDQEPATPETTESTADLREPAPTGTTTATSGHEPASMRLPPARRDLGAEQAPAANTAAE